MSCAASWRLALMVSLCPGPKPVGGASTIVAVSGDGISLIREGVLPYERVLATLETVGWGK